MKRRKDSRSGMVLLTVLFVLLALLALSAPFLASARDVTKQSGYGADEAQARLSLDSAARGARARLGESHSSMDSTPDGDSLVELLAKAQALPVEAMEDAVDSDVGEESLALWGLDVTDEAGRIDINSASPHVIANVLGWQTRLGEVLGDKSTSAQIASPGNLNPEGGVVLANGEWIQYESILQGDGGTRMMGLTRGLETQKVDKQWETWGPLPATSHGFGTPLIDQRAYALADRRILAGSEGELYRFDVFEELPEAQVFAREAMPLSAWYPAIVRTFSTYADLGAGARWQRPVRLLQDVEADETLWLRVKDERYMAPGTTLKIEGDGFSELRYVTAVRNRSVAINRVLSHDYRSVNATASALVRRPVNLNTAREDVLMALFENLAISGRNDRITRLEATRLVAKVMELRPFEHREDFLRRLVLPAAGMEAAPGTGAQGAGGFDEDQPAIISSLDALALYINGLNGNDARLSFSTMPFSFVSRDVFRMDLRASVQAPSGLERVFASRERVERVVPQRPLLSLFHRQEDFEGSLELDRNAPLWMTGPRATNTYDGGQSPPSRAMVHMGTHNGAIVIPGITQDNPVDEDGEAIPPTHVFADRDPDGYAQLWPSRLESTTAWNGRILHFDLETTDPEGRALAEAPLNLDPTKGKVSWVSETGSGLLPGISVSFWMRLVGASLGTVLDVNLGDPRTDRIFLAFDEASLTLTVRDAFGDHPATQFVEEGRVHVPVSSQGPSIAFGTWGHVAINVLGNKPTQMHMRIDGLNHGVQVDGMTHTTAAVGLGDSMIPVESLDGFPPVGVARIGSEIVEYVIQNGGLQCNFNATGPLAGFGGRLARHRRLMEGDPASIPLGLASGDVRGEHPMGTLVEHYGYSVALNEFPPSGQATTGSEIGPFRVARVYGVGSGSMDPIPLDGSLGVDGMMGIEADHLGPLLLALADSPEEEYEPDEVMKGFHAGGGYALLVQGWGGTQFGGGLVTAAPNNTPIGGVEVIRYSGKQDNQLIVSRRAVHDELGVDYLDVARAFVIDYGSLLDTEGNEIDGIRSRDLFCIPISIPVSPAGIFRPGVSSPRLVQLTHTDAGENTEWVRYNHVQANFGHLVRLDEEIVENVGLWLHAGGLPPVQGERPGGDPNNGIVGGSLNMVASVLPAPQPQAAGNTWRPQRGEEEELSLPLTHAISDNLRFRGVADTYAQTHAQGTLALPVFRISQTTDYWPGAQDALFLTGGLVSSAGMQTNLIHRAYSTPMQTMLRDWGAPVEQGAVVEAPQQEVPYPLAARGHWVALGAGLSSELVAGEVGGAGDSEDQRLLPRLAKFPSGERPSSVDQVVMGGDAAESDSSFPAPDVVVDEVLFQTLTHGQNMIGGFSGDANAGAGLVLAEDMHSEDTDLRVRPALFAARGRVFGSLDLLEILPRQVGLARIGDEILCYINKDTETGLIELAPGGRGLLGTRPTPHCAGTVLYPLPTIPVSLLEAKIEGDAAEIPVADATRFPGEGTLLIGHELIHYTDKMGSQLVMPRGSQEEGHNDAQGGGLFRGRFGTAAATAEVGTPVIFFPWRYWDRWQARSEVPELAFLGLRVDQPGALFEDVFYRAEPIPFGGVSMGALLRLHPDIPWDGDPDETPGLFLMERGMDEGDQPWRLDAVSDALEARFFVDYQPGCFDSTLGSAHGWKYSPRLRQFGVGYEAPGQVLRSVDQ